MKLEQLIANLKNESLYKVTFTEILERYNSLILALWKAAYRTTIMSGKYFPGIKYPSGTWSRPGNPSTNDFALQIGENTLIILPLSYPAKMALWGNISRGVIFVSPTGNKLKRGKRSMKPYTKVRYVQGYDGTVRAEAIVDVWAKDVLHFIIPAYTKLLVQRLVGG